MIGEALYTCASFCCVHRVYGQQAWVSLHGVGGYLSAIGARVTCMGSGDKQGEEWLAISID